VKWKICLTLKKSPRIFKTDILLIIFPALAWLLVLSVRPLLVDPRCFKDPNVCQADKVFVLDRFSIGMNSERADHYSFVTQNLSGFFAVSAPLLLGGARVLLRSISPFHAIVAIGVDLVIMMQAIVWNGFLTESMKIIIQRPRPFVYEDPIRLGVDPAHYSSFYSGHTSFSAAASAAALFVMMSHGASNFLCVSFGTIGVLLIGSTGAFRVLSGRHFLTDVLAGALAGILVSWVIAYFHRKPYSKFK
jgi:membrane-associated phospholipid phosphatase